MVPDTTIQPIWLRTLCRELTNSQRRCEQMVSRGGSQELVRIRVLLREMLSAAADRSDWLEVATVACWVDALDAIDRWIQEAAPPDLSRQLDAIEQRAATERFDGLRAVVPDLNVWAASPRRRAADHACGSVRRSMAPRDVCRAVREAFEGMSVDDPRCGAVFDQLVEVVRSAGESMAMPSHEGSLPIQRAVRLLDGRLHIRLEQLPTQVGWLFKCDDVWTEPGAMVVMSGIIEDTRRRRGLAVLASPSFWSEADTGLRRRVLECVQTIHAGTDDAGVHARVRAVCQERGEPPRLGLALKSIAWPDDPIARMHWTPPPGVESEAGRLLERLRARDWYAERRNRWAWKQASMEVEAASRSVLGTLRAHDVGE
jgi:hypothetical protein